MGQHLKRAALAVLALVLTGCGGSDPASMASNVTRAVYGDDVSGVVSQVDQSLAPQISRASVGALSDKMHALGQYDGLTLLASDPGKREYTYSAKFSQGSMNVVVRLDANGKLAAYRVFPTQATGRGAS